MSFIPFNAVSGAATPIQRSTNDLVSARRVQSQKDSHHSEEVDELDDTAVNSVRDQRQRQGQGKDQDKKERSPDEPEEKVEITTLHETPPKLASKPAKTRSVLDISA